MNVFSEKYIRNTERGTIRWLMLLESSQFLVGNPEWRFTKPLLVVLTSLKTSALAPDVAAKNCLPQTKSPGSNTEVLATDSCFTTITILLCCPVSFNGQAPFTAAALALCNDGQCAVPHSEVHTRLQRTEPSKPGQGSPLPHTLSCHTLLLAVTVSVTHCWVCLPWDIGSISCSETIKFFQPQSVFNKAKQATKLRFEIGLYFCFLHCTRERWKTPNCASELSFSPRIEYRIRGFPELNHWWFSG